MTTTSWMDRPLPAAWRRAMLAALCASMVGLVLVAPLRHVASLDLWWHLRLGAEMVQQQRLVQTDQLSFTSTGEPFDDGSWLWDVGAYLAYRLWPRVVWLSWLRWALVALTLLLALRLARGRALVTAGLLLPACLMLSRGRFLLRPDIVTPLFGIIYVSLFVRLERRATKAIWWLVPLQALWANLHPGHPLGLLLVAGYVISTTLAPRRARPTGERRQLAALLLLVGMASLATPDPSRTARRAAVVAESLFNRALAPVGLAPREPGANQHSQFLREWQPTLSPAGRQHHPVDVYVFYTAMAGLGWLLARRRLRAWRPVTLGLLFLLSLSAVRMLYPYAVIVLPLAAHALALAALGSRRLMRWYRGLPGGLLVAALIANNLLNVQALSRPPDGGFGVGLATKYVPEQAVRFLDDQVAAGPIFNHYHVGGYLLWKSVVPRPTFIDGRLVSWRVFNEYERAFTQPRSFDPLSQRYGFDTVLLSTRGDAPPGLLRHLEQSPDWALVYSDPGFVLYLKDVLRHRVTLERFSADHGGQPFRSPWP